MIASICCCCTAFRWALLTPLLLLLCSLREVEGVVVFGTENGYDVDGGKEAICWVSNTILNRATTTIEELNDNLFREEDDNNENSSNIRMMRQCFQGTSFTIDPVDLEADGELMYTNKPYTFQLTLEVNDVAKLGTSESVFSTHLRIMLCSAIRTGFCNPIVDTTDMEKLWKPVDTDIMIMNKTSNSNETMVKEEEDDHPYAYNSSDTVLRGISVGGSHMVTRWVKHSFYASEQKNNDDSSRYDYSIQVDVSIQIPHGSMQGPYVVIGHAVTAFNTTNSFAKRLDIANAIPNHLVNILDPPTNYLVTRGLKIYLGIVIGIASLFQIFLIGFLCYHQHHTVITLAQGRFLIWLVLCTLVSTVFSFTFLPTRDWFCRLHSPLVLIPLSMSGAILCGRLWRVYVTISPALKMGGNNNSNFSERGSSRNIGGSNSNEKEKKQKSSVFTTKWGDHVVNTLTCMSNLQFCPSSFAKLGTTRNSTFGVSRTKNNNHKSFRQKVSPAQTVRLIIALCVPQMVLQAYLFFHFSDAHAGFEYGSSQTNEIGIHCCIDDGMGMARDLGALLCALLFVLAVVLSWLSKDLPSMFNEKNQIFQAAACNSIVAFIALSLEFIIRGSTTSPDVMVFLWSIMTLALTTTINYLIVLPKVKRVMSKEKVVMTSLISDKTSHPQDYYKSTSTMRTSSTPTFPSKSVEIMPPLDENADRSELFGDEDIMGDELMEEEQENENDRLLTKKIRLNKDDPMPRSVCISVLQLREVINGVNHNINNGRTLTIREWDRLRRKVKYAQNQLDRIDISWTEADENQAKGNHNSFGFGS